MDNSERENFKAIVAGFEDYYRLVCDVDSLPDDLITRAAFYQSCLTITLDGPRLKSKRVQAQLVHHYRKLRDEAYAKIVYVMIYQGNAASN